MQDLDLIVSCVFYNLFHSWAFRCRVKSQLWSHGPPFLRPRACG